MLNENSVIKVKGKKYTMEKFVEKFEFQSMEQAIPVAELLIKQGKATVVIETTKEDDLLKSVEKDFDIIEKANDILAQENAYSKAKREEKNADEEKINISLAFKSTVEAETAEDWVNDMGIEDTSISIKKGVITLKVENISPQEYSKIARRYSTDKAIATGVDYASSVIGGTTDAINYTATKVIAPVAKIAGEAGLNVAKGVTHTAIKTGAGLINSGAKAILDTKRALQTDSEMIKAQKELKEAKHSIKSFFANRFGSNKTGNGIERY